MNTNKIAARYVSTTPATAPATAPATGPAKEIPTIFKVEERMAKAIREMASAIVADILRGAGLEGLTSVAGWKALKGAKEEVKLTSSRMYDSGAFGSLRLRGLEKKAAKEVLWEALKASPEVSRIESEHIEFEGKARAGFSRRNQNNHVSRSAARAGAANLEAGGLDDWRAYQKAKARNGGMGV